MKNLLFGILFIISIQLSAQTWINWDFTVPQGKEMQIQQAFDTFMTSDTGKTLGYAAMTSNDLGMQTHTHSFSVWHEDISKISPFLNWSMIMSNPDFQQIFTKFGELGIEGYQASTGSHLISSEPAMGNSFQTLWFFTAIDPMKTAMAFKKMVTATQPMLAENNVAVSLGQIMSGASNGESHYVIATFKNYETFMNFSGKIYQTDAFLAFSEATADNINTRIISRSAMGVWNMSAN